jgi:hypothetical protein
MTAWLISALERLPPWARRVVVVVVALLLIGAAITALTIAPSPGTGVRRAPVPRRPARQTTPHPSRQRVAPPVPAAQLRRAHDAAERFLRTFLPFAYGRARAPAVTSVTPALRRQLVRERTHVTPAERQRRPRVVSLRLVAQKQLHPPVAGKLLQQRAQAAVVHGLAARRPFTALTASLLFDM